MEFLGEIFLPLVNESAGADDETALEIAARNELFHQQAGHDGFSSAWIVGEEKTKGLLGQHGFIDGRNLMGDRLHERSMNSENRIEEMSETDAVGFGDKAEEGTVAIEGEGAAGVCDFHASLVVAEEQLIGDAPRWIAIDEG